MTDDIRPSNVPTHINLQSRGEIDYWLQELGVREPELRKAIFRVGNAADAVREFLAQQLPDPTR